MPAYKVIPRAQVEIMHSTGFIPDQPADIGCEFIHSCELEDVQAIIDRFYSGIECVSIKLDIEQIAREGFTVKFEPNKPYGNKYWHYYRGETVSSQLLSTRCIIGLKQ